MTVSPDTVVERRRSGGAVDIAYEVRGTGSAVVLLHGTSASHAVWEPVARLLSPRATTIAVDQRGHGASSAPASGYGGGDFADDVVAVLDDLGVDRAIVAGHSLGARNAWVVAARHPDRVRAAVCVDYTPFVDAGVLRELRDRVAAGYRSFDDRTAVETYLAERYPRLPSDAVSRRAQAGYRPDAAGRWWPLADPAAMMQLIDGFGVDWADEFLDVVVPMTHLRGADSKIVDDVAWERARRSRPADRWLVVDDVDHYVPEERPDIVAAEIARLLPLP